MNSMTAEMLECATVRTPAERAEVATRLLRSARIADAARHVTLREDVTDGLDQIDAGEDTEVPTEQLGAFVHGLGHQVVK